MTQFQEIINLDCPHCDTRIASIVRQNNDPIIESFSSFVLLFPDTEHKNYRFICGSCGETSLTDSDIWTEIRH